MYHQITLNDKEIIEEALRTMRAKEPTVPVAAVKNFLAKVGEEIERTGALRKETVDVLLQQLQDGEI
jgi:hypothetical protein